MILQGDVAKWSKAGVCKTSIGGSNPPVASNNLTHNRQAGEKYHRPLLCPLALVLSTIGHYRAGAVFFSAIARGTKTYSAGSVAVLGLKPMFLRRWAELLAHVRSLEVVSAFFTDSYIAMSRNKVR